MEQELSIYTSGAPATWHDLIPTGAGTQYLHFRRTWYLAWSDTYWSRNSVYALPEHLIPGMIWYLLEQELNIYLSGAPDIWNDPIPTGAWAQCWPFLSTWYLEWYDTYWSTSSVLTLPEHLISGMIWYLLEHELSVYPSWAPNIWAHEFTPPFVSRFVLAQSLVFYVVFCRLMFLLFSFVILSSVLLRLRILVAPFVSSQFSLELVCDGAIFILICLN